MAWFINNVLGDDLQNFWTMKQNQKYSWLANKLIKLRDLVYPWLKLAVGNGRRCRFWIDNWSPYGNLTSYFKPQGFTQLGIPHHANLNSLWRDGGLHLPPARSEKKF